MATKWWHWDLKPGHLVPSVMFSLVHTVRDPSNSDTKSELQGKVPNVPIAKFVMIIHTSLQTHFYFLKEMRNWWNSEVRQPEAIADHIHMWVPCWTSQETFLMNDFSEGARGQFLGRSPFHNWDLTQLQMGCEGSSLTSPCRRMENWKTHSPLPIYMNLQKGFDRDFSCVYIICEVGVSIRSLWGISQVFLPSSHMTPSSRQNQISH